MSIPCSVCGRLSRDVEFCDHCNADLRQSAQNLPPEHCALAPEDITLTLEQRRELSFPDAWLRVRWHGGALRLHWLRTRDWEECRQAIERRLTKQSPVLAQGRAVPDTNGYWLAYDASGDDFRAWEEPLSADPVLELQRLSAAVRSIAVALESLHQERLVWLNFDPNVLEDLGPGEDNTRRLRITNLDLALFPEHAMPERVRVHPHYSAPEIMQYVTQEIGPRSDVFHLAMFAYYWLAQRLPDGLPGAGLEQYQYDIPHLRIFAPDLPVGILPVIQRGQTLNPRSRHETPTQFADAFDQSIARLQTRRAFSASLRWDAGGHTRTGRCKAELQRSNEDTIVVKDDVQSALLVVADGVSTCEIGSGGLASTITSIVLENAFAEGCTHDTFPDTIAAATKRGSEGLLEWALAHQCRADLEAGKDLMGTTVTVGWLEGHEISVANLGDSRAYLITQDAIEQLTVDGDLASDLMSNGASPEEVKELGSMARALRECVGGCTKTPEGELSILPESCHPRVGRWPLMPGDVLVLCTDGLVEEGFFLDPPMVAEIVRAHRDLTASDLALRLVEAADSLQRVPTILEPDGFGDNISCVVVKIMT
jgi:serine/threonine protein phosphatase PrpC